MAGYADLWYGGTTIAALLLTSGYLIFVPIAIMGGPSPRHYQTGRGKREAVRGTSARE